jgi:hypothetical protein
VAGCATPTGSAGHAGATTNLKLTFHLDYSAGADHTCSGICWAAFAIDASLKRRSAKHISFYAVVTLFSEVTGAVRNCSKSQDRKIAWD